DADALGNEPLFVNGKMVGRATAGGFGWRVGKSLAIGFLHPDHAAVGAEMEIDVLGTMLKATVVEESPYDPENAKLRGVG
ncbi:MAG: hypothetical protein KAT39_08840, partial [Alphaproteobacteria bacterium]|nr:hypothetical protein [Alphaproteobacteria bacterium]